MDEHERVAQLAIAVSKVPAKQKEGAVCFALPFFLTKIISALPEHANGRRWSNGSGIFFPSRRVQTTYRSLSTEERRTGTRSREWGNPRCRVSPKAPLKIVASSKPHKRFTVGQTMRVRAFPSFYSLNRATTQTESSIAR